MLNRKQTRSGTSLYEYHTLGYKYTSNYGGTPDVVKNMINCDSSTTYAVMTIYVMTTSFCNMKSNARGIKKNKKNAK